MTYAALLPQAGDANDAGGHSAASDSGTILTAEALASFLAKVDAARGEGLEDPSLAVGLSGLSYWSNSPFLNLMKQSTGWGTASTRDADGIHLFTESGLLDENGYPRYMTEDALARGYKSILSIHHANDQIREEMQGVYVIEYKGEGRIETGLGTRVTERETLYDEAGNVTGGRLTAVWDGHGMTLAIKDTDPNGTENHIRDISVVKAEYKDLYDAGAIFDPRYLETIQDHHTIRFMNWMGTNSSDVTSVDHLMSPDFVTWDLSNKLNGESEDFAAPVQMPIEVMVRLANEIGADPWFNIPLKADDDYVRHLIETVKEHLDPRLTPKFELSNEVWNWAAAFQQTREASGLGSDGATTTSIKEARQYYGYRSAEIREIIDEAAGHDWGEMVLGTQTVYYRVARWAVEGVAKYFAEKGIEGGVSDVFDSLAVTGYFSGGIASKAMESLRDYWYAESEQLFAAGERATKHDFFVERAAAYLADGPEALTAEELALAPRKDDDSYNLMDTLEVDLRGHFAENKKMAEEWGLELIQYEADSHISPRSYRGDPNAEWYKALNTSPEMGALTQRMGEIFREEGGTLANDFGNLGQSNYGLWGTRAYFGDDNPVAQAWETYNLTAAGRFGSLNEHRDATAFLQGVTREGGTDSDLLLGTVEEDYLLGGDGSDVLVGGAGDDGLHGGAGEDTAVFHGSSREYTGELLEDGILQLSGLDGEDRLVDIEHLAFESGETLTITEFLKNIPSGPLLITGVNRWSALGGELGIDSDYSNPAYTVVACGATVLFDSLEVKANYRSLQTNRGPDGSLLGNSALETAERFGKVIQDGGWIHGSEFGDTMLGRPSADLFSGGDGNDWINGRSGDDILLGGAERDTFVFGPGSGDDIILDFSEEDRLDLTQFHLDSEDAVYARAHEDTSGDLAFDFGEDGSVTLQGLDLDDLGWIHMLVV